MNMLKKAAALLCALMILILSVPCAYGESITDLWVSPDGSKGKNAIAWYKAENKNYTKV